MPPYMFVREVEASGNMGIGVMIGAVCFLVGACFFSFINVLAYRIPRKIPYWSGRSKCTSCMHVLGPVDMIPVAGWFIIGGKCRYCKAPVSPRYAAVELLGGIQGILCWWKSGISVESAIVFAFLSILTLVALVDADTMEIPNGFVAAVAILGVVSLVSGMEPGFMSRMIGVFCVSLPMLILALAIPGAFGGGDIKLMAAGGLMLGWRMELFAMFAAILTGGIYGIWLLASGKKERNAHFAFGPFLSAGMAAAILVGEPVLSWYLGLFMY